MSSTTKSIFIPICVGELAHIDLEACGRLAKMRGHDDENDRAQHA
jgi:hypothetical protein